MKQCEYDPPVEKTLIVDLFIFGLNLKSTQKSLLKEGNNLSIAEALHVAETKEATLKQVEAIQNTQSEPQIPEEKTQDAHAIKAGREYYNNSYFCGNAQQKEKSMGVAGGQGILQSLAAPETRKTQLVNEMGLQDQQNPNK